MEKKRNEIDALKQELMNLLEVHDPRALQVIRKIRKIAIDTDDVSLLGYAYYRYAYYYYFSDLNLKLFRKYLQLAIRVLLRSDDREFLGGAYNLVAYDAQDLGCYDVAYAFFMIAVQTCEQVEGIALPGLIEANAGRILIELGEYRQGRQQLGRAARRLRGFPSMHVYNYNMILTYAEMALASFLLGDRQGVERAIRHIEAHDAKASEGERALSTTYYLLSHIYRELLNEEDKALAGSLGKLLNTWKKNPASELSGLIFEIESLCGCLLARGLLEMAERLLQATQGLEKDENLSVAFRYHTLWIRFCECTGDAAKLRRYLRAQHEIRRKQKAETVRMRNYSMEFADMIENITEERDRAREENIALQRQANTDDLTGLPNRNAMNHSLSEMFRESQEKGIPFGIGVIDVDRFKQYNDAHGHRAGDECLRAVGRVLLSFASDSRLFCARFGGDEFVVGYLGIKEKEIRRIAEYMNKRVMAETARIERGAFGDVQISQGIYSGMPEEGQKFWDFLALADQQLYKIKEQR